MPLQCHCTWIYPYRVLFFICVLFYQSLSTISATKKYWKNLCNATNTEKNLCNVIVLESILIGYFFSYAYFFFFIYISPLFRQCHCHKPDEIRSWSDWLIDFLFYFFYFLCFFCSQRARKNLCTFFTFFFFLLTACTSINFFLLYCKNLCTLFAFLGLQCTHQLFFFSVL